MLLNKSMDQILSEMKAIAATGLDAREGSFTDHVLRGAAFEIAADYYDQNAMIPIAFVDETSGIYIDRRAGEYGITRKPGAKATATVTFVGTAGTLIPAGTGVTTVSGLKFYSTEPVELQEEGASVTVEAEAVGYAYNVPEGTITSVLTRTDIAVASATVATGGSNPETDKQLLARLYDHWRRPATSGNVNQYREWAMECDGVGGCLVEPLWAGNGTVRVLLVDQSHRPCSSYVCAQVKAHIEELRPVGATVTVAPASIAAISVDAVITLSGSSALEQIQEDFQEGLGLLLDEITLEGAQTILYNDIWFLLRSVDGVRDVTSLQVNGDSEDIHLAAGTLAGEGTVSILVAD